MGSEATTAPSVPPADRPGHLWAIYAEFPYEKIPWRLMETWPQYQRALSSANQLYQTYACRTLAIHNHVLGDPTKAGEAAVFKLSRNVVPFGIGPRRADGAYSSGEKPPDKPVAPPVMLSSCRDVVLSTAKDWHVWVLEKETTVWRQDTPELLSYADALVHADERKTCIEVQNAMAFHRTKQPRSRRAPPAAPSPPTQAPPEGQAPEGQAPPSTSTTLLPVPHKPRAFPDNIRRLHGMLQFRRPHNSPTELTFITRHLIPLGVAADGYNNYFLQIPHEDGTVSPILWSSHTDTVHNFGGMQKLYRDGPEAFTDTGSNCLGADDTAGVWLMTEMILRQVPGLYMFHRGEESGGKGSRWAALDPASIKRFQDIKFAIALDRRGQGDIINRQSCGKCASDKFVESLADILGTASGESALKFKGCSGSFTDTASYVKLIPECTNISVGYENAHSVTEFLNIDFCSALLETLCKADFKGLVESRKTTDLGYDIGANGYGYGNGYRASQFTPLTLSGYINNRPQMIEAFLEEMGITLKDLTAWELTQGYTEVTAWKRHQWRKDNAH